MDILMYIIVLVPLFTVYYFYLLFCLGPFFIDHKPIAVPFGPVYISCFWTPLKGQETISTIPGSLADRIVSGNWFISSYSDSLTDWYDMVSSVVRHIRCRNIHFRDILGNLLNVQSVPYLWGHLPTNSTALSMSWIIIWNCSTLRITFTHIILKAVKDCLI